MVKLAETQLVLVHRDDLLANLIWLYLKTAPPLPSYITDPLGQICQPVMQELLTATTILPFRIRCRGPTPQGP